MNDIQILGNTEKGEKFVQSIEKKKVVVTPLGEKEKKPRKTKIPQMPKIPGMGSSEKNVEMQYTKMISEHSFAMNSTLLKSLNVQLNTNLLLKEIKKEILSVKEMKSSVVVQTNTPEPISTPSAITRTRQNQDLPIPAQSVGRNMM